MNLENNQITEEKQKQEIIQETISESKNNKKKYLIIFNIIVLVILSGGIFYLLEHSEPKFTATEKCDREICDETNKIKDIPQQKLLSKKCGDGICDEKEKSDLTICPKDCDENDKAINEKTIGFIGCSITHNAVDGYNEMTGDNFWNYNMNNNDDNNFGGGCISVWNKQLTKKPLPDEKNYWEMFENLVKENPQTEKIWWEICTCDDVSGMRYNDFLNVLNNIKKIAPTIDIYVSPMPNFIDSRDEMCKTNLDDIGKIVGRMIDENEAIKGPFLSALPGSQTAPDGCHATEDGKKVWGQDLKNFFNNLADDKIDININASANADDIPSYVLVQHYDPVEEFGYNPITKKGNAMGFFKTAKQQVEYATGRNVKLSIWLGVSLTKYILDDSQKIDLVGKWIKDGHEIGIHHHGVYKPVLSWDGYSALEENKAIQIRKTFTKKEIVENYLGTLEDYMEVFHELENELAKRGINIEIKSGVNNEQFNKKTSMPDEIIYSTASGFINNGDPGRFLQADSDIIKAVNEYITVGYVNGIKRKWLTHYTIGKKYLEEKAEIKFNELDSKTVFVAVNHNYQNKNIEIDEQTWFRAFVDFLHEKDPNGDKSMTVTEVIESEILPEKEVEFLCEEKNGTICGGIPAVPSNCSGEWLDVPQYSYNVYGDYSCCLGNCEW